MSARPRPSFRSPRELREALPYLDPNSVAYTLTLPLWGRKVVTEKVPDFFSDSEAARICRHMGVDLTSCRISPFINYSYAFRHQTLAGIAQDFLAKHPQGTVVNLGAGLDTLFTTIDNGECTYVNVDVPEVCALREEFFPTRDREFILAADITTENWMRQLPHDPAKGILFVSGGVLFYIDRPQVAQLIDRLGTHFPGCQLVTDWESAQYMKRSNTYVEKTGNRGAPLIFSTESPEEFKELSQLVTEVEPLPYGTAKLPSPWKIGPINWLILHFMRRSKKMGFAVLTIDGAPPLPGIR